MPRISSANIACGGHAGNENSMLASIAQAAQDEQAAGALIRAAC